MLSIDRCRAILNGGAFTPDGRVLETPHRLYSDDEVRAVRDFLYALARAVHTEPQTALLVPSPPPRSRGS